MQASFDFSLEFHLQLLYYETILKVFLNHLRISDMMPRLQILYYIFPTNKDILQQNHSTTIKIRKLTLLRYYCSILGPHSNFAT